MAGLKGVLYPFLFHKLKQKTPLILLLGGGLAQFLYSLFLVL